MLESYPWRGPLSLDLKPFTVLPGIPPHLSSGPAFRLGVNGDFCSLSAGGAGSPSGSVKSILPLSSSSSLHPFSTLSCQDGHVLPLYKASAIPSAGSALPSRAFSPAAAERLKSLPPLTDLPLLSALQTKKAPHCRDPRFHSSVGSSPCLLPLHGAISPHGPSLLPHLSDTAGPYCLYRYSIPVNPQLTAISRHAKLEDTTDCLLRQSPWHPTTNHCL